MKFSSSAQSRRGFTLAEMIIVIGIIGLLTTVVLFATGDARASARDRQRIIDLENMQLALELYREANGVYPSGCASSSVWKGGSLTGFGCTDPDHEYIQDLAPLFISELPEDENVPNNSGYIYRTNTARTGYKLLAFRSVENTRITSIDDMYARCDPSCTSTSFCQMTSGALAVTYAVYHDPEPGDGAGVECY